MTKYAVELPGAELLVAADAPREAAVRAVRVWHGRAAPFTDGPRTVRVAVTWYGAGGIERAEFNVRYGWRFECDATEG